MTEKATLFTLRTRKLGGKILHTEHGTWTLEELGKAIIIKVDPDQPLHTFNIVQALMGDPDMIGRTVLLLPDKTEFVELVECESNL